MICAAVIFTVASWFPANAVTAFAAGKTKEANRPHHVFLIVLENESYDDTFAKPSEAPYLYALAHRRGKLLSGYYAIGHDSLDNYIAMISGQAPNDSTQSDCPVYADFKPHGAKPGQDGQVTGIGCVYPASVLTIANQLDQKGLKWRAYMEGMTRDCEHPAIGDVDSTQNATLDPKTHRYRQYAARHDPFVYFHALIDRPECGKNVVPLTELDSDLKSVATTPNFAFITPNLCNDGHDSQCVDGKPGGLVAIDRFLKNSKIVDRITASPAFKKDGMLIVTFDEAGYGDGGRCCAEQPGPNTAAPGKYGPGGGKTGAIVISKFSCPGTVDATPYNHYSLLKSVEQLFGLHYLGFANQKGLKAFGPDVYDAAAGASACKKAM
ncbi:MAG: alkaline phosphatase family protein [Candidatus Binataceae bacterium]